MGQKCVTPDLASIIMTMSNKETGLAKEKSSCVDRLLSINIAIVRIHALLTAF
jgi:hypothetical protein